MKNDIKKTMERLQRTEAFFQNRLLRGMEDWKNIKFGTMQFLAVGFLLVIFVGGVLLWLPFSNQQPIAFTDALFTSTTAVCVTGLMTVVPVTQFTLAGKIILLLLIQIGGFGVVAMTTFFFVILGRKITVKERAVIQETYNLDSLAGMVKWILKILKGTLLVEGAGAVLFAFQFIPEYGVVRGIWYGIFHSISAFCNAGIDILGADSFVKYAHNPLVNLTTMTLIVVSGIGYTVWFDIIDNMKRLRRKEDTHRGLFKNLTLHSKLAISMTAILLVAGTVLFLILEFSNPETLGKFSFGDKLMGAAFQSVTTRTAGFYTVPQGGLKEESLFISCLLMFVGGSPAGTAGGVKTTTIAMFFLTAVTVMKGNKDTECFGRRIEPENIRTGISVVIAAFTVLIVGTTVIAAIEPMEFLDILFELTSAVGTVGLSVGITGDFHTITKYLIMIMMYAGRIGPVTMALAFGLKKSQHGHLRQLPTRRIMIG